MTSPHSDLPHAERPLPPLALLGPHTALQRTSMLRTAFGVRGAWNLAFVAYLIATAPSTFPSVTGAFARFVLMDGLCALLIAAVDARATPSRNWLWPVLVIDGVARAATGLVVLLGPGLPYFPITLVLYVLVAASLAVAVGLVEIVVSGRLHRGQAWNPRTAALGLAGVVSAALGATALGMDPHPAELRVLLLLAALAHGIVLSIAAALAAAIPPHDTRRIARRTTAAISPDVSSTRDEP